MQEIIAYRNPVEAAVWHGIMENGDMIIPVFGGMIVFFIVFLVVERVMRNRVPYTRRALLANIALALGVVAGGFTIKCLML